jgi:hypothetical protein
MDALFAAVWLAPLATDKVGGKTLVAPLASRNAR